jgi:hypothetical protein
MKLFQRIDRVEGEIPALDIMLSWGVVRAWHPYTGPGGVLSKYIRFMTPFTLRHQYVCPNTFQTLVGPCRWSVICKMSVKSGKRYWFSGWHAC